MEAPTEGLDDYREPGNEHRLHQGGWRWINYVARGRKDPKFKALFPRLNKVL